MYTLAVGALLLTLAFISLVRDSCGVEEQVPPALERECQRGAQEVGGGAAHRDDGLVEEVGEHEGGQVGRDVDSDGTEEGVHVQPVCSAWWGKS